MSHPQSALPREAGVLRTPSVNGCKRWPAFTRSRALANHKAFQFTCGCGYMGELRELCVTAKRISASMYYVQSARRVVVVRQRIMSRPFICCYHVLSTWCERLSRVNQSLKDLAAYSHTVEQNCRSSHMTITWRPNPVSVDCAIRVFTSCLLHLCIKNNNIDVL